MPEIGETRTAAEMGRKGHGIYVWTECERGHTTAVSFQDMKRFFGMAGRQVPNAGCFIYATRGQPAVVRAEHHSLDTAFVNG